jgi:hypothetical protein
MNPDRLLAVEKWQVNIGGHRYPRRKMVTSFSLPAFKKLNWFYSSAFSLSAHKKIETAKSFFYLLSLVKVTVYRSYYSIGLQKPNSEIVPVT